MFNLFKKKKSKRSEEFGVDWETVEPEGLIDIEITPITKYIDPVIPPYNKKKEYQVYPLHMATEYSSNIQVIKGLIDKGCDIDSQSISTVVYKNNMLALNLLVDSGGVITKEIYESVRTLEMFLQVDKYLAFKNLLRQEKGWILRSMLFDCEHNELYKIIKIMSSYVVDVGICYDDDNTILHWAVREGLPPKIINLLLGFFNADINKKNDSCETPFDYLVTSLYDLDLLNKFSSLSSKETINQSLLVAVREYGYFRKVKYQSNENLEIIKSLIKFGANVNYSDQCPYVDKGTTPLHVALLSQEGLSIKIIELLIRHGANVNAIAYSVEYEGGEKSGYTPLGKIYNKMPLPGSVHIDNLEYRSLLHKIYNLLEAHGAKFSSSKTVKTFYIPD